MSARQWSLLAPTGEMLLGLLVWRGVPNEQLGLAGDNGDAGRNAWHEPATIIKEISAIGRRAHIVADSDCPIIR